MTDKEQLIGEIEDSEGSGATIYPACPHCGQFCKIPETYLWNYKDGVKAKSFCRRCNKKVFLDWEFI